MLGHTPTWQNLSIALATRLLYVVYIYPNPGLIKNFIINPMLNLVSPLRQKINSLFNPHTSHNVYIVNLTMKPQFCEIM